MSAVRVYSFAEMGSSVDRRCGFGNLKDVHCLQRAGNLLVYSLVLGLIFLGVTASYSYMSAVQTTTSTVFSFSATDIGIWYAAFEVGSVLANIGASYFLTHKHIPNVLSFGLIIVVVGCLLHGMPHLYYDYGDKIKSIEGNITAADHIEGSLCLPVEYDSTVPTEYTTAVSVEDPKRSKGSIALYGVAGFLNGAGYAPFYPLGLVYIDQNVQNDHESSKYLGISMAFYTIGPVLGFGAGAAFLDLYVTLGDTYLTPTSAQWIGAYWIGYFVFGAFLFIMLPILLMFPKRLPIQGFVKSEGDDEKLPTVELPEDKNEIRSLKAFVPTVWRLLLNPLYISTVLGSCTSVYYLSGWISFLPKYFQVQFNYSASDSSMYAGVLPPLFGCIAVFIGGFLASKYRNTLQTDVKLVFGCTFISTLIMIPLFFMSCDQYPVQTAPAALNTTSCMKSCGCDPDAYIPLCDSTNTITYKSPCLVGCQDYLKVDDAITYTGCLCDLNVTMTDGLCKESDCSAPIVWIVLSIVSMIILLLSASPAVNIVLRCVSDEDKPFALGLQSALNSLLAWIPAPILYGALIDSTCSIWEHPNATFKGYCLEYENVAYKNKYLGVTIGAQGLTCLFLGVALAVSRMARYLERGKLKNSYSLGVDNNPDQTDLTTEDSRNSEL